MANRGCKIRSMKLYKYIKLRNYSVDRAAKEIGVSRQWLHKLLAGQPVSRHLAPKIVEWSEGAVSLEELMYP